MQQHECLPAGQAGFFEGMAPLKYSNIYKRNRCTSSAHLLSDYFVGRSLSLVSCSPAELTSVSASKHKFTTLNYIYNLLNFPATSHGKSEKKSSGWGPWYKDWWEPTLVGMYKGNTAFQNFRMAPQNSVSTGNHSLLVYPNPTDDILNIRLEEGEEKVAITITDMTGKLISQQNVNQPYNSISLKELPAGLYILHAVFSDHTSLTTKISVYGK